MTLTGTVARGEGLGRKLGFPTANLEQRAGAQPPRGVWAVTVEGPGLPATPAVCNVGVRPTVSSGARLTVEVHLPNFDGDLYGKTLSVRFDRKLRDEMKFASLDELKAQIRRDIADLLQSEHG